MLKKHLGPPFIRLLVQTINKLPSKILILGKNGMQIENYIEVIGASGQCFACKKLGHLKKNYPTRVIKDSVKETLEAYGTIGHQRPPTPRPDKDVMKWQVVGKTHVLCKFKIHSYKILHRL